MPAVGKEKIIAMIPARLGSKRLAMKNLALLNGRPLIYYAIKAAKDSGLFGRIVVNSEHTLFAKIARRYRTEFYMRPAKLATSRAESDSVVYDFINNNPCDIVVWVNPTSPLQDGSEIREVVDYFLKNRLDSLITVRNEQVHCIYKGRPLNFKKSEKFARTQDLHAVRPFVYSLMMWRSDVFKRTFKKKGYAFFCGKSGFYSVSKQSAVIIKKKDDLMLAECLLSVMKKRENYRVSYDKISFDYRKD